MVSLVVLLDERRSRGHGKVRLDNLGSLAMGFIRVERILMLFFTNFQFGF